LSILGS